MAEYPRSWLCNAREWVGYLFTALVGIPAAAFGWILLDKGVSRLSAVLISITVAVIGGFALDALTHVFLKSRASVSPRIDFRLIGFTQTAVSQNDAARLTTASVALYVVALSVSGSTNEAYQLIDTLKAPVASSAPLFEQ